MNDSQIEYRHIKTNAKISLEQLKKYKNEKNYILTFYYSNIVEGINEEYSYNVEDIPFSNDFEVLYNSDFTINELYELYSLSKNDIMFSNNLPEKIEKLLKMKLRLNHMEDILKN
jgi:hypothetical protein